jgi:hypothetical protein
MLGFRRTEPGHVRRHRAPAPDVHGHDKDAARAKEQGQLPPGALQGRPDLAAQEEVKDKTWLYQRHGARIVLRVEALTNGCGATAWKGHALVMAPRVGTSM